MNHTQTILGRPPAQESAPVTQILREAVANAVRHGGADRIGISARMNDTSYRLTVADNGRGFPDKGLFSDSTLRASGRGPKSILDRVGRLGGQLQLETTAGQTMLHLDLPSPITTLLEKSLP